MKKKMEIYGWERNIEKETRIRANKGKVGEKQYFEVNRRESKDCKEKQIPILYNNFPAIRYG